MPSLVLISMLPVVLFTGLSGSGKSTLSKEVARQLRKHSIAVSLLDGDEMRKLLSPELGYSRNDRCESARRISALAGELNRSGNVVLIAAIAPYECLRSSMRTQHECFAEIFVDAPLAVCEGRDPKGLYHMARTGQILEFTGISSPYEIPTTPDLICRTHLETLTISSRRVTGWIRQVLRRESRHAA